MSTLVHESPWPDRVIVGTVGVPGARTFYLQVRNGRDLVSFALEKEQSALLAEKIDEILDELMTQADTPFSIPAEAPAELVDDAPLEEPVEEQFRIGAISLGWDPSTAQIVIEAYPRVDDVDDDDPIPVEPAEMLMLRIPVGTARAFTRRAREVVGSGRPLCPLCGEPMSAGGHSCGVPDGL